VALPWVRVDTNLAQHDKILGLIAEKPNGYQAAFAYVCGLGYAGGQATDGLIPFNALPFIHATKKTAELLVKHHLWEPHPLGWTVRNFDLRQQSSATSTAIKRAQAAGAQKANCRRWHGETCKCWEQKAS
jgi:hypothetical protein